MSSLATAPHVESGRASSNALRFALWTSQVLLAVAFGMAGAMKATLPIAELAEKMLWPGAVPAGLVRFIGLAELAAAVGLVLPAATRIRPHLTTLAAMGLVIVMALASVFHLSRGEAAVVPMNALLGALAGFVAWGRWKKAPIAAR